MIEGRNITKRFGDRTLFENLSFVIEDGDFVCFSGTSGKGKTTLLNIIGLLEPFDEGELLINRKYYTTNKQKMEYYRSEVGFLFQNFALIENKTVKQNLELIRKESRTQYSIPEVVKIVGMSDMLNSKVYTLSGGEQQRIALARLFLKKCEIILADEPTGSLDEKNSEIILQILLELNLNGKTVIIVTHDNIIKNIARRVIEL